MKWTVTWLPAAINRLATIWRVSPDKKFVSLVANELDRMLETEPDKVGLPYRGHRVLFVGPLGVTYAVYPAKGTVEVIQVERISQ